MKMDEFEIWLVGRIKKLERQKMIYLANKRLDLAFRSQCHVTALRQALYRYREFKRSGKIIE